VRKLFYEPMQKLIAVAPQAAKAEDAGSTTKLMM
jgi:hypothetical protein